MEQGCATEANPRPLRVVVVDDVDDVRLLLRMEFDLDARFEVVGEGADGDEAIELARRLQPDLLVLDRNMPRRGGVEAIGPVREVSPSTAIVLYTATLDESTHHAALAAGALDVLEKAAGPQFIESFTAKLLDRASAGGDVEIRVGPVDGMAARIWIANSRRIVEAVAAHPEVVEVPDEAIELFRSLLSQWEDAAAGAEEFLWVARASLDDLRAMVEQWSIVDTMSDEQLQRLGVRWAPLEAQPFFDALTTGVLRALERHEETARFAGHLKEQWAPWRSSD